MSGPTPGKTRRSRRRRLARALVALVLLIGAGLAGAWVWLESGSGQEYARRWLEARGTGLLQRETRIAALDFDLLPFNATISGITVAGAEGADQPLLQVAELRARLQPWALLSRELRISVLEVDTPIVHWHTGAGPNLALEARGGGALAVTLGELRVSGGAVEIDHSRWNLDATLADVDLRLEPTGSAEDGRRRDGLLRIGDGGLRLQPAPASAAGTPSSLALVAAEVPFTVAEEAVRIDGARLQLGNSEMIASGTVLDGNALELDLDARLDVRDAVGLSGLELAETDTGTVTVAGTLTYGAEPLHFGGSLTSPSISLMGIDATDLSADIEGGAERLVIDNLHLATFDGELTARIEADLAARPRSWQVRYEVDEVDLNALSNSPVLPGFRFAGRASARGDLAWSSPVRDTLTGAGTFDLTLPSGTLERLERAADAATTVDAPAVVGSQTGPASSGDAPEATPRAPLTDAIQDAADALPQVVAPSLPLPVTAHADFEITAEAFLVRDGSAALPRNVATFGGILARAGDLSADLELDSDDLRMLDRFFNQIRRFRGEQPVPRPFGLTGSGRVTARLGGTLEAPVLDGDLEARGLAVAGTPVGDIDGILRLDGGSLQIADLQLRRNGGTGEGEGRLRIGERATAGPDYNFGLRLQDYPMEVDLPRLGTPLTAAGETSGEIALRGSYGGAPVGRVALRSENVRLNGLEQLRADVRVRLEPEAWVAERFELSGAPGVVTINGSWLRATDTIEGQLEAFGVEAAIIDELSPADLPLGGTLQLQAQLSGSFAQPDAAATLRWSDAAAYGVNLGSVALSAELLGGALAASAVGRSELDTQPVPPPTPSARGGAVAVPLDNVPPGGWAATLSADTAAPRRATVRAAGASDLVLAFLAAQGYEPGEGVEVGGSIEAQGSGVLGAWIDWQGTTVFSDFVFERPGLSFSLPQPATLELGNGELRVDLPRLVSEAGSLQAGGIIDLASGTWREARATGLVSLAVLEALSDELEADGTLEVDLEATGEVLAGDVAGAFELYDVTLVHADLPWAARDINGTILLADNGLDLVDVRGMLQERPFTVDGTVPLAALTGDETVGPVSLELAVDALPLRPLWERTGALHELITGGEASVTASIEGRGSDWRTYNGSVEVRSLRVDLTDLSLTIPEPVTLQVRDGGIAIDQPVTLQGPGTDLDVSGTFAFAPFRLDARLQGSAVLDPLNVVTQGWGIAGLARLDVRVSGQSPQLAYDGTVDVSSGLLNTPVLQPIENITAELRLENRLVQIVSFTGSLGETGVTQSNVSGSGEVQLVDNRPRGFELELDIDEALLRIDRGIRVTASAELFHQGTLERSILSGSMTLTEGEYTQRWEGEDALLGLSEGGVVAGVANPLAETITLDVDVLAPGELRIVNNMADVELSADLQVRGTLANPVLLGSATVLDGTVLFNDNRYRFLRGALEFQNPLRTEPSFDISLETSIRQYLVTLNASGSPARGDINVTFVSSPPLSDLQLIQLLTVGDAPDSNVMSDDETLGAVGAQATSFLTRQYFSQVERGAQRVLGIDRLRVDPAVISGNGDPTARVTLGKQVTPDLFVSWTTVLGTTEEQLVTVEYQLTRSIRLTAQREEDGSLGVDFRIDHRFR